MNENEIELLEEADSRARRYVAGVSTRPVYPDSAALAGLQRFSEALPEIGKSDFDTLKLLDEAGSPATSVSNGPNYFGFVIGASLPAAAAAERMVIAWDQCASSHANSPVADIIEKRAAEWLLEILDLPRQSAVSFGTSATSCGLACLAAARRRLLERKGWDYDRSGLAGAPDIRVVVSQTAHITVWKALRILGFGMDNVVVAPTDADGRIDTARLPQLDESTLLCLQAGEVNTGEFDPFKPIIKRARECGAWVHVDGAFGLWARANPETRRMTEGVEDADSWTTDGHKWLNTPYDSAVGICRDADALAGAMNSDASYSQASADSQKNLGLEFSRRARGVSIWAALRSLGKRGVAELVEQHCRQARRLADGLRQAGFNVLNRVVLNQVLVTLGDEEMTNRVRLAANDSGQLWFGPAIWNGNAAFRMSVSSWRTTDEDIDNAVENLIQIRRREESA